MTVTLDQTIITVGDIGAPLTITVIDPASTSGAALDISNATTTTFSVRKPDATTDTWIATFVSDGTDGKLYYATVSGDIDTAGVWTLAANVAGPSYGWQTVTQTQFRVQGSI